MPYLFTRSAQLAPGNLADSLAWSVKITEKVNAISEAPVSLWTSVMSPDLGRLTSMDEKLLADSAYLDLVEEGTRFGNGANAVDGLVRYIHADRDGIATAQ